MNLKISTVLIGLTCLIIIWPAIVPAAHVEMHTHYLKNKNIADKPAYHQKAVNLHKRAHQLFMAQKEADAVQMLQESIRMMEQILPSYQINLQGSRLTLVQMYQALGKYENAIPVLQQILKFHIQEFGKENMLVAGWYSDLGRLYEQTNDFLTAETNYKTSLKLIKNMADRSSPELGISHKQLGLIYRKTAQFKKAADHYSKAIDILGRQKRTHAFELASALLEFGVVQNAMGNWEAADKNYDRALEIIKKHDPARTNAMLTAYKNNKADLYQTLGKYEQAEKLYLEAIELYEKMMGPNSAFAMNTITNIADLYKDTKNYHKALHYFKTGLAIAQKHLHPYDPDLARILNNIGLVYANLGDDSKALHRLEQALEIRAKIYKDAHPAVAATLNSLGSIYLSHGDFKSAAEVLQRALKVFDNLAPEDRKETRYFESSIHANIGRLFTMAGVDLDYAHNAYDAGIEILKQAFGETHQYTAVLYFGKANVYLKQGNYEEALELYEKVQKSISKIKGDNHLDLIPSLEKTGRIHILTKDLYDGFNSYFEIHQIFKQYLYSVLALPDETTKLSFLHLYRSNLDKFLSFGLQQDKPLNKEGALHKLYDAWIAQKGIILETQKEMTDAMVYTDGKAAQTLMAQLKQVNSRIAFMLLKDPGDSDRQKIQKVLAELNRQKARLEDQLNQKSIGYKTNNRITKATIKDITGALPRKTILLDFVKIKKYDFNNNSTMPVDHYAVFYLKAGKSRSVKLIDLGRADKIDTAIDRYKRHLDTAIDRYDRYTKKRFNEKNMKSLNRIANDLYRMIIKPVEMLFGSSSYIFISPDSKLNLLPFEMFKTDKQKYLIEKYTFNYLNAARDLLRFKKSSGKNKNEAVLMGGPAYFEPVTGRSSQTRKTGTQYQQLFKLLYTDLEPVNVEALPGAKKEVVWIQKVLGPENVSLYVDENAQESVLKQKRSPKLLHLATHGYFMKTDNPNDLKHRAASSDIGEASFTQKLISINRYIKPDLSPFLRCGLMFTGAGRSLQYGAQNENDGILTGTEILKMHLLNTSMVVLSACNTGLGDAFGTEGVYGLSRAFFQAGAKSIVMSMWTADDIQTQKLMVSFYKTHLKKEKNRCKALKAAMLERIKELKEMLGYAPPHLWAPFIFKGQPI